MDTDTSTQGPAAAAVSEDLIVERTELVDEHGAPVTHPGGETVAKAATGQLPAKADGIEKELEAAADFLLGSFDQGGVEVRHHIRLNVGTATEKRWIRWIVKNVPGPTLRRIKAAADEAMQRKPGALILGDAEGNFEANCKVVIEGTVHPSIKELAQGRGLADPVAFLQMALVGKDGLIDQIAGQIYGISGYDQSDVQDALEVNAVPSS